MQSVLTILKSKTRDVEFELQIPDSIAIMGNITGLNQIVMNLMSNSLDAFDKPQKKITIACEQQSERIHFIFADNGSGMPQAVIDRIFDPFFTTKEVGKGTGLGMHIVAKEIEKHGGKISVTSVQGEGTKFSIELPLGSEESQLRSAA